MIFQPEIVRALWQYTALALPAQLPAGHFIAWGDGIGTNPHEDYYEDFGALPEPFFYLERGDDGVWTFFTEQLPERIRFSTHTEMNNAVHAELARRT